MQHIDRTDTRALRQFYCLLGAAIVAMFFLVLPWLFGAARSVWPLVVGGGIALGGTLAPRLCYPVYRGWMVIARALGWLNSRLLLGFAFYVMVLPIGWIARRLGKLGYRATIDADRASYRVPRAAPPTRDDLERPF